MKTFNLRMYDRGQRLSVEDYRSSAQHRLPAMAWSYIDGAAEDGVTFRQNRDAFAGWSLRQRVLSETVDAETAANVLGETLDIPILVAPTGLSGLAHWAGEMGLAKGAEVSGTKAIISTAASYTIEEVARATTGEPWFQLYPWVRRGGEGRELMRELMDRAQNAGCRCLVVTVDAPTMGNRETERRSGLGLPPVLTPKRIIELLGHPRWTYHLLTKKRVVPRHLHSGQRLSDSVAGVMKQYRFMRPDLGWSDVSWMRAHWSGDMLVKGILDPHDAKEAVTVGADGVIVSNHGGRQLDGAIASINALPDVVEAVGDEAVVLVDGGFRRGSDIVKALCLGATAVCIGRPALYGLATRGSQGVTDVLAILKDELKRVLTLMGVGDVKDLDANWLIRRSN